MGFAYASFGIALAHMAFGSDASISSVFLTTIPLVVVMYRAICAEEQKSMSLPNERRIMAEHTHIIGLFIWLFLGLVLAWTFWSAALSQPNTQELFFYQKRILSQIQSQYAAGMASDPSHSLNMILSNNLRVLLFCMLFSFLYGAGAVFILTLNASIIGVAMGEAIKDVSLMFIPHGKPIAYLFCAQAASAYLIHGIPEVAAYFTGALAGGMISASLVFEDYRRKGFSRIAFDAAALAFSSLVLLFFAALIEVYITPNLI